MKKNDYKNRGDKKKGKKTSHSTAEVKDETYFHHINVRKELALLSHD